MSQHKFRGNLRGGLPQRVQT